MANEQSQSKTAYTFDPDDDLYILIQDWQDNITEYDNTPLEEQRSDETLSDFRKREDEHCEGFSRREKGLLQQIANTQAITPEGQVAKFRVLYTVTNLLVKFQNEAAEALFHSIADDVWPEAEKDETPALMAAE